MLVKFFGPAGSVMVLAVSLTPEMTNALAILVAALFVGLVNLYMARTARLLAMKEIARVIAPVEQKIDAIIPVVAKIDGHVNSEKTRDAGVITAHKLEIALQREMIEEMRKAAALLAQATAVAASQRRADPVVMVPVAPTIPTLPTTPQPEGPR